MTDNRNFEIIPAPALKNIQEGAKKPIAQMTLEEIPPVAISWGRTEIFPTGSWRNITPEYVSKLPPCRSGCPVGNDIEGWLEAVEKDDLDGAIKLLLDEQPLPSVCGRVCYHPCETQCNRENFDQAVNIRSVERNLGARALQGDYIPSFRADNPISKKIAVIGSGPAGLSAAWLLTRLGHKVEIIERAAEPGGLLRYGIPAYRLPVEVLNAEINRLKKMGIKFRCNENYNPVESEGDLVPTGFDVLYVATGAMGHRSSGVKSSDAWVVQNALDLLARTAVEQRHNLGKRVVIIGGGNSAVDAARTAIRLGCEVTILYRRTRMEMPAYEEEVEAALAEGIKIEFLISPESILGDGNGSGRFLRCIRNVLGKPDNSGRRRPEPVPGSEFDIPIDNVIEAVGDYADPSQILKGENVSKGLFPKDIWGRTEFEGVWSGGDFGGSEQTVSYAIGAGKRAAMSIDSWLLKKDSSKLEKLLTGNSLGVSASAYLSSGNSLNYIEVKPVSYVRLNQSYFEHEIRNSPLDREPEVRCNDFREITKGLGNEVSRQEASRCFHCGSCDSCGNCHLFCPDGAVRRDPESLALYFDLDHCKGCGICEAECPRSAIDMRKQLSL